jgi:hypothetical protein
VVGDLEQSVGVRADRTVASVDERRKHDALIAQVGVEPPPAAVRLGLAPNGMATNALGCSSRLRPGSIPSTRRFSPTPCWASSSVWSTPYHLPKRPPPAPRLPLGVRRPPFWRSGQRDDRLLGVCELLATFGSSGDRAVALLGAVLSRQRPDGRPSQLVLVASLPHRPVSATESSRKASRSPTMITSASIPSASAA